MEEQSDGNDRFAYIDNGRLIVNNVSGDVVIDIYDVMGRKVASGLTKNTDTSCCVEFEGNKVKVTIGSVEHPMLPEHYIEWVSIQTKQGNQRKQLLRCSFNA